MGNKFCLEMEKSALKHMLLYIAEGHLHFILLSTTQTQLFSVKMHTLNKCIFEIISCFAKEQINMKLEIDTILVKLRLVFMIIAIITLSGIPEFRYILISGRI